MSLSQNRFINYPTQSITIMTLTFAQYQTLVITHTCATFDQLTAKTEFDALMVSYVIAVLLDNSLITATTKGVDKTICYQLTETGVTCVAEYERQNPTLIISRTPGIN
ncbi:hypothetical protein GCM10027190_04730 [Spirosoma areae]